MERVVDNGRTCLKFEAASLDGARRTGLLMPLTEGEVRSGVVAGGRVDGFVRSCVPWSGDGFWRVE